MKPGVTPSSPVSLHQGGLHPARLSPLHPFWCPSPPAQAHWLGALLGHCSPQQRRNNARALTGLPGCP